jgi:ElaB/YqjD/DUF883 family membrane-anchored ribosome-binding protein
VFAYQKEVFMDEAIDPNKPSEKVKDQTGKIKESASAAFNQARQTAEAAWHEAKNKINDLEPLEIYVRGNPVRALLVTFAIGFLTGLLCRK